MSVDIGLDGIGKSRPRPRQCGISQDNGGCRGNVWTICSYTVTSLYYNVILSGETNVTWFAAKGNECQLFEMLYKEK